MCRLRRSNTGLIVWWVAAWVPLCAHAQPGEGAAPPESPDDAVELYLAERGLGDLRAAQLRSRLLDATGDERIAIAERLGAIYMRQIGESNDPTYRADVIRRSEDLLAQVPAVDSFELRINLAKARYLRAETTSELHRLKLATPEEVDEARITLEIIRTELGSISDRVERQVRGLEGRESRGGDDLFEVRSRLATARRVRSLAAYYSAWSGYYLSFLTGRQDLLVDALEDFGVLLNAEGKLPTLERIPRSLLRYEHVARAAVGVAMCRSAMGDHVPAGLWLDEVETADGLPDAVRDQLFRRRLLLLAAADRWDSVTVLVDQWRRASEGGLLDKNEARLLAVLSLDRVRNLPADASVRWQLEPLIRIALSDLVEHREIQHVLNLVNLYGTLPIGNAGFIPRYVTAINAYEEAREAHRLSGDADQPATDAAVKLRYKEAADLLRQAVEAQDASSYESELGTARVFRGLAVFYRGDFADAADEFETAAAYASDTDQEEQALWLLVIALDELVKSGDDSAEPRRDEAGAVFVQRFPGSDRAVRLLLMLTGSQLMNEAAAVSVLLGVDASSPLYVPARRQAARLLYRICRLGGAEDRTAYATQFLDVAEALIEPDRRVLASGETGQAAGAAKNALLLLRQMLDVIFMSEVPDLERAESALAALEDVRVRAAGIELDDGEVLEQEVLLRQLQLAAWQGRNARVEDLYRLLQAEGGRYADLATTFLFRRADERYSEESPDAAAARRLVDYGVDFLAMRGEAAINLDQPGGAYASERVAAAAAAVWNVEGDAPMRDLARRVDRAAIDAGLLSPERLRRYAELSEQVGDLEGGLDAWRLLSAGLDDAGAAWYEARYNVIRLLLSIDPVEARAVLDQHFVLYPDVGPEPWGSRIRELERAAPVASEGDKP